MTDLAISLLSWQQQVWDSKARFKVVAAGRRTGKSRLAAYLLIVNALQAKQGQVFYVAPTQGQARDIMWQVLLEVGHEVIKKSHINNLQITLINGTIISLKGADRPETMRGVSLKFLVMDEYADMKPSVWEQILRPALTDQKGAALFIGTPMGRNHFYDLYKLAELKEHDTYESWHFTSYDNNLLDKDEIDMAKKSMSSFAFRQEYMASFEARDSDIFKEEWIQFSETEPEDGEWVVSVDMAGFEEGGKTKVRLDETAICLVKVHSKGWWVKDIQHGRWQFQETARRLFNIVEEYNPIVTGIEGGIAKQAIRSPLIDLMKIRNMYFTIKELSHGGTNKITRITSALEGRLERGALKFNRGKWNVEFMDQLFQFPNRHVHDDLVDSLSYVDQLQSLVASAYSFDLEYEEHELLDVTAGY